MARELKYSSGSLDPERLKAELAGGTPFPAPAAADDDEDDFDDPYAPVDEPAR